MPRTAVSVSQPLTSRFWAVVRYEIGSFAVRMIVRKCSATLRSALALDLSTNPENAMAHLIDQNARRTHGTFSRCHSFSTSADSPKLVAKILACW